MERVDFWTGVLDMRMHPMDPETLIVFGAMATVVGDNPVGQAPRFVTRCTFSHANQTRKLSSNIFFPKV